MLGGMRLIILGVICLIACSFLLFVLFEGVLDAKRKAASHSVAESEITERLD